MDVASTLEFWRAREPDHPGELAHGLREFSVEAAGRGEEVLAGTLKAAAERLEREELGRRRLEERLEQTREALERELRAWAAVNQARMMSEEAPASRCDR